MVRLFGTEDAFSGLIADARAGTYVEVEPLPEYVALARNRLDEHAKAAREHREHWLTYTVPYVLAVLDTGLVRDHPKLRGIVIGEADFTGESPEDEHGHGTAITLKWLVSAAPPMAVLNVKVVGQGGESSAGRLVRGVRWLADWARRHPGLVVIANLSLGQYSSRLLGWGSCAGHCRICRATAALTRAGVRVLAAAGNEPGRTCCPATLAVRRGIPRIDAIAASDFPDSGIGTRINPSLTWLTNSYGLSPAYEQWTRDAGDFDELLGEDAEPNDPGDVDDLVVGGFPMPVAENRPAGRAVREMLAHYVNLPATLTAARWALLLLVLEVARDSIMAQAAAIYLAEIVVELGRPEVADSYLTFAANGPDAGLAETARERRAGAED